MTLRDPVTREAYAIVRADKARQRKERKEADRQHIRAIVESKAPNKRQPRERDNGYLAFLRRLPCVACVKLGGSCGPTQAAHLRFSDAARGRINSGMQQKPSDRWATPLGAGHHAEQHAGNERAFWDRLGIDAGDLCEALYAAFLAGHDAEPVVRRFGGAG